MGRCGATNKCEYCSRIEAVVQSEMLALDALEGEAPTTWCVLTTSDTADEWDAERYRRSMGKLLRAVKRRCPGAEYVCIVEFTTGYAEHSGGKRRPHWNLLWKGASEDELRRAVTEIWCARENAVPAAQWVGHVDEFGGLMRYLALHFLKESQRPPNGWSGKRVRYSGGYFARPRWRVRRDAEDALRLKREVWRAERDGLEGEEALVVAEAAHLAAKGRMWEVVHLTIGEGGQLTRVSTLRNRTPETALPLAKESPVSVGLWMWELAERVNERSRVASVLTGV